MTAADEDDRPETVLLECLRDPARGRRRLPAIVGLLEADDRRTRLAAAWSCCLVAEADPETVSYLVRRLADRLDDEASLELTHALDYLVDRYPSAVESVLEDLAAEAAERADRRSLPLPETGSFTRNYYYDSTPQRRGVGRLHVAGADDAADPRRAYTADDPESSVDRETDEAEAGDREDGDEPPADGADGDQAGANDEAESGALVRRTSDVSAIAVRSRFDRLHVLAARRQTRYSEDYDTLVGQGATERAIALRLLHRPADRGVRPDFEADAGDQLRQWASVDDHPHVVSLLDWGQEPRPWIATSFAGDSLAELDRPPATALEDAIALADAVAHCHRTDVVHAGIDPGNVAYPGDVLEDNDQEPPLLNNVGLVSVYRRYGNPADLLDPRYAAPEYYDRRFGVVDAATDVYGLGAVIYYLFAGEPPVTGTFESVKAAVTGPKTPVPGDVRDDVPAGVDDVVARAMAAPKLQRYEAVDHLRQDLVGLREDANA